jgi:hypothetical protein
MVFERLDCALSIVVKVNVQWCKLVLNSLFGDIIPEGQICFIFQALQARLQSMDN